MTDAASGYTVHGHDWPAPQASMTAAQAEEALGRVTPADVERAREELRAPDADDFIRAMAARDPQELEQQRAEAWEQPGPAVLALIADFIDPDDCWHDHHGYCQAHGWFATDPSCPHARAKALLAQQKDGEQR